jgi:hypothetical protein
MSRRVRTPLAVVVLVVAVVGLLSLTPAVVNLGGSEQAAAAGVTPDAVTPPWIRYGVKATATTAIPASVTTIAALPLPAGKYAVTASFWLRSTAIVSVECHLAFGGNDTRMFQGDVGKYGDTTMTLQVAGSQTSFGYAQLRCGDGDGGANGSVANDIRMTATKAGQLSVVTMP